jgi:hypothetical protein
LSREDRQAGYHHELALWQLECSRTDVFERPVCGRQFFEAVIRENIDLGRPSRLEVQRLSENCVLSPTTIQRLTQPTLTAQGQRAPGLRLADRRVMALLAVLCLFLHLPEGFRNRQLRTHVAALLGENLQQYSAAKMSYDLRRLRLKGLLYRKAGSTRCYLTPYGLKVSLFLTRLHARLLRPGFAALEPENSSSLPHPLRAALHRVDHEIQHMLEKAHLLAKAAQKTCLILYDFGL